MSRKSYCLEPLESRMLLAATLIGPAGTLSPDQQWLEYTQQGQAFLENVATRAVTQIPSVGTFTGDSKSIVYVSNPADADAKYDFVVYRIATGVTAHAAFSFFPSYSSSNHFPRLGSFVASPDGQYVAFEFSPGVQGIDSWHDIFLFNVNAGSFTNPGNEDCFNPAFSPDSQNIAYTTLGGVREYNILTAQTSLLSIDSNGQPIPAVSTNGGLGGYEPVDEDVFFSPDGRTVAFTIDVPEYPGQTDPADDGYLRASYLRDLTTGQVHSVDPLLYSPGTPYFHVLRSFITAFSPDGKFLLQVDGSYITNVFTLVTAPISQAVGFGADDDHLILSHPTSTGSSAPIGLYSYDMMTGISTLLTTTPSGAATDGVSKFIANTADRSHLFIQSTSTDLASNSPVDGSNNMYLLSTIPDNGAPTIAAGQPVSGQPSTLAVGGILANDGHHVAFMRDNALKISDVATGTTVTVPGDYFGAQGVPFAAQFTADGQSLMFATSSGSAELYGSSPYVRAFRYNLADKVTTGLPFTPNAPLGGLSAVYFSPEGRFAVGAYNTAINSGGNTFLVADLQNDTGYAVTPVGAFPAFSPDDRFMLVDEQGKIPGIYQIDLATGNATLISTDSAGKPLADFTASTNFQFADEDALVYSNDGKFAAFSLGPSKMSGVLQLDTYVRDMQTGVVTQYDFAGAGNASSNIPPRTEPIAFGDDDQYLLEASNSTSAGFDRLSLVDLATGQSTVITDSGNPAGIGFGPGGGSVIFDSSVSGLQQVYRYDIASEETTLLSTTDDGHTAANGNSFAYDITRDGATILLTSSATNLTSSAAAVPGAGSYMLSLLPPDAPAAVIVSVGGLDVTGIGGTAIDFGVTGAGQQGAAKIFLVKNTGGSALVLGAVSVPSGFVLLDGPGGVIDPGATVSFRVAISGGTAADLAGDISFTTSDAAHSSIVIPVRGRIQSQAVFAATLAVAVGATTVPAGGAVDFGTVPVGASVSRSITLRNDGTADLTISNIDVPSGFVLQQGVNVAIAPGESAAIVIAVDTSAAGNRSGVLTIASNDPGQPAYSINLSAGVAGPAQASAAVIRVTWTGQTIVSGQATAVSLGSVRQNAARPQTTLTIHNDGNTALIIGQIELPGGVVLVTSPASTIAAGGVSDFVVAMRTDRAGSQGGEIVIHSNDLANGSFTIPVHGTVVPAPKGIGVSSITLSGVGNSVVGGASTSKAMALVTITNRSGKTAAVKLNLTIFAGASAVATGGAKLGTAKVLAKLKANQSITVKVKLSFPVPLADRTAFVVAGISGAGVDGNYATAAASRSVLIARPVVKLTGGGAVASMIILKKGKKNTISIPLTNGGNTAASGTGHYQFAFSRSADGMNIAGLPAVTVNGQKISIGANQTRIQNVTFTVPSSIAAGNYFLIIRLTGEGTLGRMNVTNNDVMETRFCST